MLSTNEPSIMVHAGVLEAYVHFLLKYTMDHIFCVIPIKYLINKDGNPTTLLPLMCDTEPLVSHLRVLFFHVLFVKLLQKSTKRR